MNCMTFHILGMSSSQLTNSIMFQRDDKKPPTRLWVTPDSKKSIIPYHLNLNCWLLTKKRKLVGFPTKIACFKPKLNQWTPHNLPELGFTSTRSGLTSIRIDLNYTRIGIWKFSFNHFWSPISGQKRHLNSAFHLTGSHRDSEGDVQRVGALVLVL